VVVPVDGCLKELRADTCGWRTGDLDAIEQIVSFKEAHIGVHVSCGFGSVVELMVCLVGELIGTTGPSRDYLVSFQLKCRLATLAG
jgi:hypothetical protein